MMPDEVGILGEAMGRLIVAADPFSLGISATTNIISKLGSGISDYYQKRKLKEKIVSYLEGENEIRISLERYNELGDCIKKIVSWNKEVCEFVVQENSFESGVKKWLISQDIDEVTAIKVAKHIKNHLGEIVAKNHRDSPVGCHLGLAISDDVISNRRDL